MSLISLLCLILIAGVIYWLIGKAPFIAPPFQQIAQWVLIAVVVIYVAIAILGPLPDIRLHR